MQGAHNAAKAASDLMNAPVDEQAHRCAVPRAASRGGSRWWWRIWRCVQARRATRARFGRFLAANCDPPFPRYRRSDVHRNLQSASRGYDSSQFQADRDVNCRNWAPTVHPALGHVSAWTASQEALARARPSGTAANGTAAPDTAWWTAAAPTTSTTAKASLAAELTCRELKASIQISVKALSAAGLHAVPQRCFGDLGSADSAGQGYSPLLRRFSGSPPKARIQADRGGKWRY